jgi:hypothetical protein
MSENRAAHTGKGAQREGVGLDSPATWSEDGEGGGVVQGPLPEPRDAERGVIERS